jgi:putative transposase
VGSVVSSASFSGSVSTQRSATSGLSQSSVLRRAERFVRTARTECLDWLLIVTGRHLERVLRVFVDHYNSHRPHRSLDLAPPDPDTAKLHVARSAAAGIERRDRLGGLIHEYSLAA